MNVVEKPDAIIRAKTVFSGFYRNAVWGLDGIRLAAEDIDQ
jgi:hypothetical protein